MKKLLYIFFFIPFIGVSQFNTEAQRQEVNNRLDNGYSDPDGDFINLPARIIAEKNAFDANPSAGRWIPDPGSEYVIGGFTYSPTPTPNTGCFDKFGAAMWGWAQTPMDVSLANKLKDELYFEATGNGVDFSNTTYFPRNRDNFVGPNFTIVEYMAKWEWAWEEYIKDTSTTLTATEQTGIETFFSDYADWCDDNIEWDNQRFLGANWASGTLNLSIGWQNTEVTKLETIGGTPYSEYTVPDGTQVFNNRKWSSVNAVHSYGLYNGNASYRDKIIEFFKLSIKYNVFPNNTMAEMKRTASFDYSLGVTYSTVILEGMVKIAMNEHIAYLNGVHEANGWTYENLFLWETTEGFVNGQTLPGGNTYNAGTTQTVTPKSLFTLLESYNNRFYLGLGTQYYYEGTLITGTNKKFHTLYAIASAFYNDTEFYERSIMSDADGYPSGGMQDAGFGIGTSRGNFGVWQDALLYSEMEGVLFDGIVPPLSGLITLNPQQKATFYRLFYSN